jgi:hypothetical protein
MDGQMDMKQHYKMDDNVITGIQNGSEPFSMDELKLCGTCRGPLRNVSRYGRIVRRALIDESTKRFIKWSVQRAASLTEDFYQEQKSLTASIPTVRKTVVIVKCKIQLQGTRHRQLQTIFQHSNKRYRNMNRIRTRILEQAKKVDVEEQPFKRVWDLVQNAKRKRHIDGEFKLDVNALQTRAAVQITSLLYRCDLAILSDFLETLKNAELSVDFGECRKDCVELIAASESAVQPLHQVEGHIFYAQYCAIERANTAVENIDGLVEDGRLHIAVARAITTRHEGSTAPVVSQLDDVEKMLKNSTFYMEMKEDEWKAVMGAMRAELLGSGHWYNCENGHPFTIGGCGMPMENARCPQCNARIGGTDHRLVQGVTHAADLEQRYGRMGLQ